MESTTQQQIENQTMIGEKMSGEVNDVVTFRSAGEIPEEAVTINRTGERLLPIVADGHHSVEDIMSRPFELYHGDFAAAVDIKIWEHAPQVWQNMLQTYYGFTCTYVLRIICNSTPFQTGMGMLFCPPATEKRLTGTSVNYSEPFADIGVRTANHLIPSYSCYPHVILNLGATSEVVLHVPFRSIKPINEKRKLVDQYVRWYPMTPLRGPTNTEKCTFTIYCHLEDVKVYGTSGSTLQTGPDSLALVNSGAGATRAALFQGRKNPPKKVAPETIEAASKEDWKVSDYLGVGSKVAAWVAPWLVEVPQVAAVAGAASWALGTAADYARSIGYSRPYKVGAPKPFVNNPFRSFVHTDGDYTGTKLTLSENSGIETVPLGPVDEDEMSINYIARRPTFYFWFDWDDTQPKGTCLYQDTMLPSNFAIYENTNVVGQGKSDTYVNTLLSYLATMFDFWRGSIRLTVNMGANKFYSGRLLAVFVPAARMPDVVNGVDTWPDAYLKSVYAEKMSNYRQIIDIRDANTFTLNVPYVSSTHWKPTRLTGQDTVPALFLFVEMQLRRPAAVASSFTSWISVSGGEDFALAVPSIGEDRILPWTSKVLNVPPPAVAREAKFQGITEPQTSGDVPVVMDFVPQPSSDAVLDANLATIGDPITSLRTLVKRPSLAERFSLGANDELLVDPWAMSTFTGDKYSCDTFVNRVRALFRFSAGSMRIQIAGLNPYNNYRIRVVKIWDRLLNELGVKQVLADGIFVIADTSGIPRNNGSERIQTVCELPYREDLQGMVDVEIPYYHWFDNISNLLTKAEATSFLYWSEADGAPYGLLITSRKTNAPGSGDSPVVRVYKSAADNFNCGYLVAPPMTYMRPFTSTQPPALLAKPEITAKERKPARDDVPEIGTLM